MSSESRRLGENEYNQSIPVKKDDYGHEIAFRH